jgi:TrmH family RNA methyltransferase
MREEIITSVHNPEVKEWARLLTAKGRVEHRAFLVEGIHLVVEALRSGLAIEAVIYDRAKGLDREVEQAIHQANLSLRLVVASDAVLSKLTETKTPQGVVAVVRQVTRSWEEWRQSKGDHDLLLLLCDGIQDPGNLGTMIRTAEAAGADAVVLGQGCADPYNGKVVRASMGSLFRLPVFRRDLEETTAEWKREGGKVLVTALRNESARYTSRLYEGSVAIVIGNEARGVSDAILEMADDLVHIPLYGPAESLNAAVAAGIMLYEAQRQRNA